jgi:hypothetical protein
MLNATGNTTVDFSNKLKFQYDLTYTSRNITAQGREQYLLLSNAGLRYTASGKITAGLQFNNIFNSNIQKIITQGSAFISETQYSKYDRALLFSIGYRFNETSKKKKGISTDYGEKDF